jgi:hypothetical protein
MFSMVTKNPHSIYPNQDAVRTEFQNILFSMFGLVTHAPVFKDYIFQGLKEFHQDNVFFLEIRTRLSPVSQLPHFRFPSPLPWLDFQFLSGSWEGAHRMGHSCV